MTESAAVTDSGADLERAAAGDLGRGRRKPPRTGWLVPATPGAGRRAAAALGALMVATFCLVTAENLPTGLLPQISSGLGVSLSAAGDLVAGYAVTVTVLTVPLTYATARIPRRPLLIGLMAVFIVANLGSAIAPDYSWLLASRAVAALVHAVFWAVVTVAAAELFAPSVRGRVIAMVFGATSIGTVIGVPAGTWLGQQAGWRVPFAALSGIGLLALVTIIVFLPSGALSEARRPEASTPDTRRYVVLLAAIVVTMTGVSMASTYTVPFLTGVAGFSLRSVSPLLLLRGAAGVAALSVAARLADRHPRAATTVPVALIAASFIGVALAGTVPLVTVVLNAVLGAAIFAMITTMTTELLAAAPGDLYLASAGGNAVFNAGTAAGASLGGLMLPGFGVRDITLVGGLLAAAALTVLLVDQLLKRSGRSRAGNLPGR
jgi:predicted MFS family arabinose efflux permease